MKRWILRIVLGIAGLVLLLVLGLFIASKRSGAGHNEASIEIRRPAPEVFVCFTDMSRLKQWAGGLSEATPLTDGGLRVGARLRMTMIHDGERTDMEEEILGFEPNVRLSIRLHPPADQSQTFDEVAEFTLAERDGKTTVHAVADTQYHGVFALLEPLITPAAQKKIEQHDLPALKALVEAAPPSAASAAE